MNPARRNLLVSEASLGLVTLAALVGMHRLFVDASYLPPLLLQALLAHVVVALLRRGGVPLLPAGLVTAVAAVLSLSWLHFFATTRFLLPTSTTSEAARLDLADAWRLFQDESAPVPVEVGFLIATGTALWILIYVADWAALRSRATFEALLPAATLFAFGAALGAPGGRVASAVVFAAASLQFVLLQRTLTREERWAWTPAQRTRTRWSLLGPGAVLIAATVTAGAVAGPNLPGAGADPVVAWRDLGGDDTRVVFNPLVDIQPQLLQRRDDVLFTVRTDGPPSYWRMTALDTFGEDQQWTTRFGTTRADGVLPRPLEHAARTDALTQEFELLRLGTSDANPWIPAAFEPDRFQVDQALEELDEQVGFNEESSSLIVDESRGTADGLRYQIESDVPSWTPDELRAASPEISQDIAERYLTLPESIDPDGVIEELAHEVTAGAETRYDQALALQDWFRNENVFTYDDTVGSDGERAKDPLLEFLTETRTGFCQQFAGSYAAMARLLDIPTRLAVGFTWGTPSTEEDNVWLVQGRHAHAWVEVFFDGLGWVPFDPTPGRAPVNGEHLDLSPQQDEGGGGGSNDSLDGSGVAGIDRPSPDDDSAPPPDEAPGDPLADLGENEVAVAPEDDDSTGLSRGLGLTALALGVALAGYVVLAPISVAGQRAVRRRRVGHSGNQVSLAWHDATNRARAAGIALPSWLTMAEVADRLASVLPGAAGAARMLARSMERVVYAEVTPPAEEVDRTLQASTAIVEEIQRRQTIVQRVAFYLDIRQLWRNPARRVDEAPDEASTATAASALTLATPR